MERDKAISKINEYISVKEKQAVEKNISIDNMSFINVRDRLIGLGNILEENLHDNYYIVNVPSGVANKNEAIILVEWNGNSINFYGFAKEGLINQHTANRAIDKIVDKILK